MVYPLISANLEFTGNLPSMTNLTDMMYGTIVGNLVELNHYRPI